MVTLWMYWSILFALSCFMLLVAWAYTSSVNAAVWCPRFSCTVLMSSTVNGVGVAKIMEPCRIKVKAAHDFFECKIDRLIAEVTACFCGEYKIV